MKVRDEEDEVCLINEAKMWVARDVVEGRCQIILPDEPFLELGLEKPADDAPDAEKLAHEYAVLSRYACFTAAYRAAMLKTRPDLLRNARQAEEKMLRSLLRYGEVIALQRNDPDARAPFSDECIFVPHEGEAIEACEHLYDWILRGYQSKVHEMKTLTEDEE